MYVHGYDGPEAARLHDQADVLAELLHADTHYPAGSTVLEAGCGVGAQTLTLARRSPGAQFTCIDRAAESVAEAERRVRGAGLGNATFAVADLLALPYPPASFDHVFVCFVLEHLPAPARALERLVRVVRPGGTITVIEGDHGSALFHPASDRARAAIDALVTLQARAGGDATIGRRLHPLLVAAGLEAVQVSPRLVYADGSRPDVADRFTRRTFTAMVAGVREPVRAAVLMDPAAFDEGVADLARTAAPDGTFCYTFFKAVARRGVAR